MVYDNRKLAKDYITDLKMAGIWDGISPTITSETSMESPYSKIAKQIKDFQKNLPEYYKKHKTLKKFKWKGLGEKTIKILDDILKEKLEEGLF